MAFFQKRPEVGTYSSMYTYGKQQSLLIVGLGNIGKEYEGTRHNIGFVALDRFAESQSFQPWIEKRDLKCQLTSGQVGETKVYLIKPTTFMNLSGEAVQAAMHFYKIAAASVIVVHDELDVPFGQIRVRVGGSSAGHNGIKSVTQHIGEAYGRVRVGIGPKEPPQIDSADFVLQRFNSDQQAHLGNLLRETNALLSEYAYGQPISSETRSFII